MSPPRARTRSHGMIGKPPHATSARESREFAIDRSQTLEMLLDPTWVSLVRRSLDPCLRNHLRHFASPSLPFKRFLNLGDWMQPRTRIQVLGLRDSGSVGNHAHLL